MKNSWHKLRALRRADWGVLGRCLWLIPAMELSVRWRAPRHWLPPAERERGQPAPNNLSLAAGEEVARWVDAAYRRSPFSPTCLTRSLVLYRILRARGIPCRLQIGLRKENAILEGHAWIESGPDAREGTGFEVLLSF